MYKRQAIATALREYCVREMDSCNEQPYVRTQLAIATIATARVSNIIKSVTVLINNEDRLRKPYVRTELDTANKSESDGSKSRACVRYSSRRASSKQKDSMSRQAKKVCTKKVAGPRLHRNNMYVRTQLAIAEKVLQITNERQAESIREKQERNKFINTVKDYAYLLLTTFADPS